MIPQEEAPASSAKATPSRIRRILGGFTRLVLLLVFFSVVYLVAGHIFSEKPIVTGTENKLYYLFDHSDYAKPIKTLNNNKGVVVTGNREDGVFLFVDHYLNKKISEGFAVKKRLYYPGADLEYEKYPYLAMGYDLVHQHVTSKIIAPTTTQSYVWVVESENALEASDLEALTAFANEHEEDRIVVVAPSTAAVKGSAFKNVKIVRPSQDQLRKLLKQQKLSDITIQNILDYHENDLELIDDLANTQDVSATFTSYFVNENQQIAGVLANSTSPKKALALLNAICQDGVFKSKAEVPYIPKYNGAVAFDENGYYWTSLKHTYAFSNSYGKDCDNTVQVAKVVEQPPPPPPTPAPAATESKVEERPVQDKEKPAKSAKPAKANSKPTKKAKK